MRLLSIGKNLTAGAESVVYTVPDGYNAVWNLMYLHNSSGNTKTISVDWVDSSESVTIPILTSQSFASKEYFQFNGNGSGVVLEAGDQIKMTPAADSDFGVVCTFLISRV